jgi:hypothetical protein
MEGNGGVPADAASIVAVSPPDVNEAFLGSKGSWIDEIVDDGGVVVASELDELGPALGEEADPAIHKYV